MSEARPFAFAVEATCGAARAGRLGTAHGAIKTPAFMPVGTAATVKGMTPEALAATGTEIVLGNTHHLMLRPGAERIARLGGLRRFMNWPGPVLTDSGGYQVMSLAKLRSVDEQGVAFQSHIDGSRHLLTPERAVEVQRLLGATIAMVLDECIAYPAAEAEAAEAMRRSMRWAERSKAAFAAAPGHALFGIVQGGAFPALRAESAAALRAMGFDGYAIGGLAVGEGQALMFETVEATVALLPAGRPRYLMGVGKPADLVGAVGRGIDLFDCVLPTRNGRNGYAFTATGPLRLRNERYRLDERPIEEKCPCPACRRFGRGYLRHLFSAEEMLGPMLVSEHNVTFFQRLMRRMRELIEADRLHDLEQEFPVCRHPGPAKEEA